MTGNGGILSMLASSSEVIVDDNAWTAAPSTLSTARRSSSRNSACIGFQGGAAFFSAAGDFAAVGLVLPWSAVVPCTTAGSDTLLDAPKSCLNRSNTTHTPCRR